ncbi:hypothetical protein Leryth_025026 [Lithospermum erythrorhizon]|nr:hypothetical protein Leryth_025026 [Lithospermum erythrorhizon]
MTEPEEAKKSIEHPRPDLSPSENEEPRKLLEFSYQELKAARKLLEFFRPDSILGEGGFGYVFKGWIEVNETAPAAWLGITVAAQESETDGLQGHREYNAKLSDFGLKQAGPQGDKINVYTQGRRSIWLCCSEYVMTGHLTSKSHVYSFGVVLL